MTKHFFYSDLFTFEQIDNIHAMGSGGIFTGQRRVNVALSARMTPLSWSVTGLTTTILSFLSNEEQFWGQGFCVTKAVYLHCDHSQMMALTITLDSCPIEDEAFFTTANDYGKGLHPRCHQWSYIKTWYLSFLFSLTSRSQTFTRNLEKPKNRQKPTVKELILKVRGLSINNFL